MDQLAAPRSTLLGSSFSPATCLAKLAAAQRRPSPCKVLSADLQDETGLVGEPLPAGRKHWLNARCATCCGGGRERSIPRTRSAPEEVPLGPFLYLFWVQKARLSMSLYCSAVRLVFFVDICRRSVDPTDPTQGFGRIRRFGLHPSAKEDN